MADFKLIKEQVTIEAAAQMLRLELRQAGVALRGPCPACLTGGPRALVVTPSKQLFYCFAAGIGGDVISMWGHIEKCSLADAGRHIADNFGVEGTSAPVRNSAPVHQSPSTVPPAQQKAPEKAAPKPHEFDPAAFSQKLEYTEAVQALGYTQEDAAAFGVGFYRGHIYKAARYQSGVTAGYWKYVDGKWVAPKQWLPDSSNVVPFGKKTA